MTCPQGKVPHEHVVLPAMLSYDDDSDSYTATEAGLFRREVEADGVAVVAAAPRPCGRGTGGGANYPGQSDADLCYRASMRLLTLAGVQLRQHRLACPVVLAPYE
eukprot:169659-Chlamydomonas_euryale.AAC.2